MKVIFSPTVSKVYKYIDKKFNKANGQKLIYDALIDIHSKCCEKIIRYVIKRNTSSFECRHYIDFYRRLCVYSHTYKTDDFDTLGFISFKKEFYSFYKEE